MFQHKKYYSQLKGLNAGQPIAVVGRVLPFKEQRGIRLVECSLDFFVANRFLPPAKPELEYEVVEEKEEPPVQEDELVEQEQKPEPQRQQPVVWSQNTFSNLVHQWKRAHNEKDFELFSSLFADEVMFYTKKMSRSEAVKVKRDQLNNIYPSFYQEIYDISSREISANTIRADFIKVDYIGDDVNRWQGYLDFQYRGGRWQIVRESDTTTDSNQRKREAQKKK